MTTDIEQRISILEDDMADVKQRLAKSNVPKDWRQTIGMSKGDVGFEEMIRLGREIREQERENES